jgi:hypothetical protein
MWEGPTGQGIISTFNLWGLGQSPRLKARCSTVLSLFIGLQQMVAKNRGLGTKLVEMQN